MGDVTITLRHPREATEIVKIFVHRYKQASMTETYHFRYLTVKAESHYLEGKTERNNRKKMIDTLE
jgi:hypothetical protein